MIKYFIEVNGSKDTVSSVYCMCYSFGNRRHILKAREAKRFGIIMGTLGRQGSPAMFQHARRLLSKHGKQCVQFLMAEIQPQKLALIDEIDVSAATGT